MAIIQNLLPQLHGTLQFSLEKLSLDEKADYWTLASLAELVIMTADNTRIVKRTYKKSLTAARKNIYNLQSSISTLQMLDKLQLRPEFVAAGVQVLRDEIRRIQKEEPEEEVAVEKQEQQTVFLFKGHQIDSKDTWHETVF